jgi:hypothetical protein
MIWMALCAVAIHASAADSLCEPNEEVFFNCRIKDSPKLLSVCGRAGEEARRGTALPGDYLQYRFGPRDKPELVFPKTRKGSLGKFRAANEYVPSAFYDGYQLSFQSGGTAYRVYAIDEVDGPSSPPEKYGGVIVGTASGRDITIPCGGAPENGLGGLVREFDVAQREAEAPIDGATRATFQMCHAMPIISGDSDFKRGAAHYEFNPLNDAFMLGLHNTPEIIELKDGAVERLVAKPQHGKLSRNRKKTGREATWRYTPALGFVGDDHAEFAVRGKTKAEQMVEFRFIYRVRVTPEKYAAYIPQPGPPLLSVARTYCVIPTVLLDYVGTR